MKKAVIFGTGQLAELMQYYLVQHGEYEVCGLTADSAYLRQIEKQEEDSRLEIVPFEDIETKFPPEKYEILIALGYTDMNHLRERKMEEVRQKGYRLLSYQHPSAIVQAAKIGNGCIILEGVVIGVGCEIGDGNIFYPMAHVAHHTKVENFNFFTISCSVAGNVTIGSNCVFGNNCTVKNGIEIADETLVGAGAYVNRSIIEKGRVCVPERSYILESKKSSDFKL